MFVDTLEEAAGIIKYLEYKVKVHQELLDDGSESYSAETVLNIFKRDLALYKAIADDKLNRMSREQT